MAASSCCGVQSGAVASGAPVAGLTTSNDASVVAATPSIVIVTCSLTGSPCLVLLAICETCDPECRTRTPGCAWSTDGPVTKVGRTAWSGPVHPFGPGWPERRSTQHEARRPPTG